MHVPHSTRRYRPRLYRPCLPSGLGPVGGRLVLAVIWAVALLAPFAPNVGAEAPPLAIAMTDIELRLGPGRNYPVLATIPAGAEVVLTGKADAEFVGVIFEPYRGWAEAAYLDAGHRTKGIILATATTDVALRAAPYPDGEMLQVVPAGARLIITGAVVGDYIAASYDGIGGWVHRDYLE